MDLTELIEKLVSSSKFVITVVEEQASIERYTPTHVCISYNPRADEKYEVITVALDDYKQATDFLYKLHLLGFTCKGDYYA